jgi:hypothetical protein
VHSRRLLILLAFLPAATQAQWLNFKTPGVPRTRDGEPLPSTPEPQCRQ